LTPIEIGILGIVALIILLLIRVPVGISLLIVAALGNSLLTAPGPALELLGGDVVAITQRNALAAIPLFILTGVIMSKTNVFAALFELMKTLFGRGKGGLAVATIGAGAVSSAVYASERDVISAMQTSAISQMRENNYNSGLISGITAVGSSLALLIPPSLALIVFGVMAEASIPQLLLAGILPGGILTVLLMLAVPIALKLKAGLVPDSKASVASAISSLKAAWVAPVIFLKVFVLIYFGWGTPTEAAATSAGLALLYALITKQMSMKILTDSLVEAMKASAKVLLLVIGGSVFGLFFIRSLVPMALIEFFSQAGISLMVLKVLALLIILACSLFFDKLATLTVVVPIVFPILQGFRANGVLFGILAIFALMIGTMLKSHKLLSAAEPEPTSKKQPKTQIAAKDTLAAIWPFIILVILLFAVVALFPITALFLPSMMFGL